MNLYKEAKDTYKRDKRKRLGKLKRQLWWSGAKPKQWEYDCTNGKWRAFHVVEDMKIMAQLDTYASGKIGDISFVVFYFDKILESRTSSEFFRYWSDVKHFIGEKIVEENE